MWALIPLPIGPTASLNILRTFHEKCSLMSYAMRLIINPRACNPRVAGLPGSPRRSLRATVRCTAAPNESLLHLGRAVGTRFSPYASENWRGAHQCSPRTLHEGRTDSGLGPHPDRLLRLGVVTPSFRFPPEAGATVLETVVHPTPRVIVARKFEGRQCLWASRATQKGQARSRPMAGTC
jgi:hypothetical protein